MFLYLEVSHKIDHHDWTITCGLYLSAVSVVISLYNAVMFQPNAFDPVLIELEFKKRQEERARAGLKTIYKYSREVKKLKEKLANALGGTDRKSIGPKVFNLKQVYQTMKKDREEENLKKAFNNLSVDEIKRKISKNMASKN